MTIMDEKYKKYYINLLRRLISFPSVSGNEVECAKYLEGFLRDELGMNSKSRQVEKNSWNVYGSYVEEKLTESRLDGSVSLKHLILGGHIDVVPPEDGWDTNPFELTIKDGKAYGRGTYDMKGGLAAQITALKILKDEGIIPNGRISLIGVCDEERLSIGANAFVKDVQAGILDGYPSIQPNDNSFFIMAEPHFDNIVIGATGKVLLELKVKGTSGHAAEPESGINAIDCMSEFVSLIGKKFGADYLDGKIGSHCFLKIESKYEGYSLNIPDECTALLNKQLDSDGASNEDADEFIKELYELYNEEIKRGELIIEKRLPYYPSYSIDKNNKNLLLLFNTIKRRKSNLPELRVNRGVSDANVVFPMLGIPTILFGPGGADLHKPNEHLDLNSAYEYICIIHDYILEFFD